MAAIVATVLGLLKAWRRPSEAEHAERRAKERALMVEAVEQLESSEGWKRWLRIRRHFHNYSLHNQLLIALQMPEKDYVDRLRGRRDSLDLGANPFDFLESALRWSSRGRAGISSVMSSPYAFPVGGL